MPVERIAMRDVREIVRLRMAGLSTRQLAIRIGVAASTVRLTLRRLEATRGIDVWMSRTGRGSAGMSNRVQQFNHRRRFSRPYHDWPSDPF